MYNCINCIIIYIYIYILHIKLFKYLSQKLAQQSWSIEKIRVIINIGKYCAKSEILILKIASDRGFKMPAPGLTQLSFEIFEESETNSSTAKRIDSEANKQSTLPLARLNHRHEQRVQTSVCTGFRVLAHRFRMNQHTDRAASLPALFFSQRSTPSFDYRTK